MLAMVCKTHTHSCTQSILQSSDRKKCFYTVGYSQILPTLSPLLMKSQIKLLLK